MYSHGLIPQGPYVTAVNACGWTNFLTDCSGDYEDPTQACQDAVQKAINYVPSNIGKIATTFPFFFFSGIIMNSVRSL